MSWTAPARRLAAAIAAVVMLLAAVAPMLSQALAVAHGAGALTSVICTADGVRVLPASAPSDRAPKAKQLDHCPLCVSHAGAAALPPTPVGVAIVAGADAVGVAFLHAPRTLFAWTAAQPRAPPSIS